MSEFSSEVSVSKLTGAAPGYVGYEKEFDPFREGKMKITKSGLQKIINEEIENFLSENK